MPQGTRPRTVVVVDNSAVARRIGDRIRRARLDAGLTQAQVAEGRYTPAYISALERGLSKPSIAALTFIGQRLGASLSALVAEEDASSDRHGSRISVTNQITIPTGVMTEAGLRTGDQLRVEAAGRGRVLLVRRDEP